MTDSTKARLLAFHHAALTFLVRPTKMWVAVGALILGFALGLIA